MFFLLTLTFPVRAQLDDWMKSELGEVKWQQTYKGVLADYHPVEIMLASDYKGVAGYLMHAGDQRKHKLVGEWSSNGRFQLQEHDEYNRLTGYLTGYASKDQLQMEWMSADQTRLFSVKAFPSHLIRIKNFKPIEEWIEISCDPPVSLSVQKMDFGIVSGIVHRAGQFARFEGYCLDGGCSIWNTVIQNPAGAPIRVEMRQKDDRTYRATLNAIDYAGQIRYTNPLTVRHFDNSMGFQDLVYPEFTSKVYDQWLDTWMEEKWSNGVGYLTKSNEDAHAGRLVHRSSGWIEVISEGESFVSGLITYVNPGSIHRDVFVWLRKEDQLLTQADLIASPDLLAKHSQKALAHPSDDVDEVFGDWLNKTGYTYAIPTPAGVVLTTRFDMVYGDHLQTIPAGESKELIKKKYWKYFGW